MTTRGPLPESSAEDDLNEARAASPFPIVGIGASAGGLEAFSELLRHLPLDTGMAFVLVQHLDPQHESALSNLLQRVTSLPVHEVTNNQRVEPDRVYVIPPNTNLGIAQGVLKLQPRQESRAPHRSIDFFLESLAQDQRDLAIGVILSGTATDGTLGLEAIKAEGGITFAQDGSAKYESMPRSAVAAGCVDFVLKPMEIAQELERIARHPYVANGDDRASAPENGDDEAALPSGGRGTPRTNAKRARAGADRGRGASAGPQDAGTGYRKVLLLLRNHCGVDFSLYKSTTIQRRITRRMILNKHHTLEDYARFLRGNTKELDALYSDALISVTSFFRNPEAFDVLKQKVFPKLLQQRGDEPLRVWVLGCSTGQEAYSIAMAFVESTEKAPRLRKLQVFATDLNEALLERARHGLYAKSLAEDVSPNRLRRFFVEEEGGYRVAKSLREMVVFARQNLISDPPFSRMDLISCRNLLIYLETGLQKKVFPTFHYALRPGGFLFLGASESILGFTDLFEAADKKHKIYSKKSAPTPAFHLPVRRDRSAPAATEGKSPPPLPIGSGPRALPEGFGAELNAQREADRLTVVQFAPPGVLVNAEFHVLQFRGPTRAYLEPPTGKATFDVLKMAREGLMLPLRAALHKAKKENKTARTESIRVRQDGKTRIVNVEVIPLKNLKEPCFLILFEDVKRTPGAPRVSSALASGVAMKRPVTAGRKQESSRAAELERELLETRDYLQSVQEQYEAANEELQSSNEEVQSANEELQSVNEELETSKEELESANEELTTVNEEMVNRNTELNRLYSDLVNLQTSTQLVILLLGRDLAIRRFSASAEKQFNLSATDLGRHVGDIRHRLQLPDLEPLIAEVISSGQEREREVQDQDGHWYLLRVRPYLTLDQKVDGAVLVLTDIDELKRSEQAVEAARDYAEAIVGTTRDPLVILDADFRIHSANESFYTAFGLSRKESEGRSIFELGNREWDVPPLREMLGTIIPSDSSFNDLELTHDVGGLGPRTLVLNARALRDISGQPGRILVGIQDVTEQKQAEEMLRKAAVDLAEVDSRKNAFLAILAHELRNPLAPIRNALHIVRLANDVQLVHSATEMMERQIAAMVRLVDDLLDVSRVSRGKIELRKEHVELASVVNHAVEAASPAFENMSHRLAVSLPQGPVYLDADPIRLTQVFGNLLNNACKFTNRGGSISLTARLEGDQIVVRVRDNGVGIATDMLPRVFEMFTQVDTSLERSAGGLGIGLTLVKSLVEMHGGRVEAHSAGLGEGSEFLVQLPVMAKPKEPVPQEPNITETPRPVRRRILIVDDNHDSAKSLAMVLELMGNQTRVEFEGRDALEAAESFRPELILLDIGMPKMNGYEVARKIREQPWGREIVLVALTGWGQAEDRQKSKEAGFDSHLVKPVDLAALRQLLANPSRLPA